MKRPFVSAPQDGPGHKAVTLVAGRDRLRIECQSNEQAKELSLALIGLFKRVFPKTGGKARLPMDNLFEEEARRIALDVETKPHHLTLQYPIL